MWESPKPLASIGGGVAGIVLSDAVIRAIDRYSRLDTIMKISGYVGWLLSPEVFVALMVCGLLTLFAATKHELERIIRHFALGGRGDITPELFKWDAFKAGGIWAGLVMVACVGVALAITIVPLLGTITGPSFHIQPVSPPSQDQLRNSYLEIQRKHRQSHPSIGSAEPPRPLLVSAPAGIAIGGGTVNNPTVINTSPPQRCVAGGQYDQLVSLLKAAGPHKTAIRHSNGNLESQRFADCIAKATTDAGWEVIPRPKFLIELVVVPGVRIFVRDISAPPPSGALELQRALMAVGIDAPAENAEITSGLDFEIFVGVHP